MLGKVVAIPILMFTMLLSSCPVELTDSTASGNSYYVSVNGNDDNPGNLNQPWRSIRKANQTLQPGDTVYIREGTYNDHIEPYRSGVPGSPITYRNYQDEVVKITGKAANDPVIAIGLSVEGPGTPNGYIIIDGFHILHDNVLTNGSNFFDIRIQGSKTEYIVIRNCRIEREGGGGLRQMDLGIRETGIIVENSKNIILEGNTISGVGKIGIWLSDVQNAIVRDNHISHTGQSSINIGRRNPPPNPGYFNREQCSGVE